MVRSVLDAASATLLRVRSVLPLLAFAIAVSATPAALAQTQSAGQPATTSGAQQVSDALAQANTDPAALPTQDVAAQPAYTPAPAPAAAQATPAQAASAPTPDPAIEDTTYDKETVVGAATGVFGKGAEGVGRVIESIFSDLGRPNAYIVGREGGGAFFVGLRYGDGDLYHKVEGQRKVHWTGPSVGFDIGGDASKAFILVYDLNDTQEIFKRFPAIEGKVYFIGGFSVSYHQNDNIVIVPIRLGAGWRLGANVGYYHFTEKRKYIPF